MSQCRLTSTFIIIIFLSSLQHARTYIFVTNSLKYSRCIMSLRQTTNTPNLQVLDYEMNRKIFCNVELNGESIEAVGFDMDYTLAQYKVEFDLLAFDGAKEKLVSKYNYPKEVLTFQYTNDSFRRGLVIDKTNGNILKLDRHKYHRKVFHGLTEMSREERKYSKYGDNVYSYTESEFAVIDTLFLLVDAVLFAHLVDLRDRYPNVIQKSYEQIYKDIRNCVDMCHRDGVIKDAVMKNPSKYIIYDPGMVHMLTRFREEGKKLFLLTNSMWEYTNQVMKYLVYHGGTENEDISSWETLFDVVIVGGAKPAFLMDDYLTMFRVEPDGMLKNLEDKAGLGNIFSPGVGGRRVFQGGQWQDLQKLLAISAGDKILYVGDHMYSDILKSKRNLGWRTCLIIPELDHELRVAREQRPLAKKILRHRQLQYDLDEYMDMLRHRERLGADVQALLQEAEAKAQDLKQVLRTLGNEYNSQFNLLWGPLFKAGYQDSRFAKQVCDYACLYTSRASNLGLVDPNKVFRTQQAYMPHDQLAIDIEQFHNDFDI